ncbi:aldehyde dehydrogenase family protein [Nonomuraea sp. NPDC005650]|uniref:aldehyde dehydrogenase family protein n=1 Tax=Nonomuraea sp. NPDC005650 TaxID=3157045 RepID=UPI0033B5A15B
MSNKLHDVAFEPHDLDLPVETSHGLPLTDLVEAVLDRRHDLLRVLTQVATYQAAEDEIYRSLRSISGAAWELRRYNPRSLAKVSAFLPSNNLLYSYVLHGIIPALYSAQVSLRPSTRVAAASLAVHEILRPRLKELGLRIVMRKASQREFAAECATGDVTLFSGRPENAGRLAADLPGDVVMLSFGSGPNPIVVGPEADLDVAVRAIVRARMYNSGQDCLSPDIVFVHDRVLAEITGRVEAAVAALNVGERKSPSTDVAALVYPDAAAGAEAFLRRYTSFVRHGGHVQTSANLVEPTLVVFPWTPGFHPPELFAPIVLIMGYPDGAALEQWLNTRVELERGMYLSVFGEPHFSGNRAGTCTVVAGASTFDMEDGNQPFGGYGVAGGSVRFRGVTAGRPLLLSAEMSLR